MTTGTPPSPPKPRHRLLLQSRQWHKWGGLAAALFLLLVGATGMVLNYKKPVFSALGLESEMRDGRTASAAEPARRDASGSDFTTVSGFSAAAIAPDRALALACESLGDVPLERIELKSERGDLVYKIKARSGNELWVNAASGARLVKGEYEKVRQSATGDVLARQTDWGKVLLDLHTGKIGGDMGKAVMTVAAGLLLFLSASGVYLWLKPLLLRRQNARTKAQSAATLPP